MGWGANGKNMQGGKGGCPTTNAAERAMLEGYRMGVGSRYQQGGGGGGHSGGKGGAALGKGGGKLGKGVGRAAGGAQLEERTCQRIGCTAAIKKQATFGGGCNCFRCGLSMVTSLPVEQLVDWAWQKRLDEQAAAAATAQAQAAAPAAQPNATVKAAGSASNAPADAEGSAALRTKRLALLKQAKEQANGETAAPTPTQEVARVFVEAAQPPKKLVLDKEAMQEVKDLDSVAAAILEALQLECMPAEDPLKQPQDILEALLAKSNHAKKDSGKSLADQALQVTTDALKAMRGSGMQEGDELLKLMVAREAQQAKEARTQSDKQPSKKSRILTLEAMKTDFAKSIGEQADGRATGATKAAERAAARSKTADALVETAKKLKSMVTDSATRLNEAHRARAHLKEQQGAEVLNLMEEKLKALHAEPAEDVISVDDDEGMPATATENELDEAERLTTLLTLQLQQLQNAAAGAQPQAAPPTPGAASAQSAAAAAQGEDNEPEVDLWRELTPDASLLPELTGTPSEAEATQLATLAAFFVAVPWGAPLPALTFHVLGAHPSVVHGLIGDEMWKEAWGEKQGRITNAHMIPYSVLNVLKLAVEQRQMQPDADALENGKLRWQTAKKEATLRRVRATPYSSGSN